MRLVRFVFAGLIFVLATGQKAPPPFIPKIVKVPALQMTGVDPASFATPPPFSPKKVIVPTLQMTGVDPATIKSAPAFTPKTVSVPTLQMTGVY